MSKGIKGETCTVLDDDERGSERDFLFAIKKLEKI